MSMSKGAKEMLLAATDLIGILFEVVVPVLLALTIFLCLIVGAAEIASDTAEALRGPLETGDCPPHGAPN